MKKLINILYILFLIVTFSACGNSPSSVSTLGSDIKSEISNDTEQQNSTGSSSLIAEKANKLAVGVIAKSGNTVSSEEKEKVITELDKKLDSLFKSINDSDKSK